MTYSDQFNLRTRFVKFNDVADAIDGTITRQSGGTTMGSNTAYTASPLPAWSSPIAPGSYLTFIPHLTNGADPTLTVSNIGPSPLKRAGVNISAGSLTQGVPYLCLYTGAYWEVVSSTETPANQFLPLTLDKTNNRVGVNSITPSATLDVYSASASVAHLAVRGLQTETVGGAGIASIQLDVNGKGGFAFQNTATSGTRKLQISSNNGFNSGTVTFLTALATGRIGLFNTNPSAALHVYDNAAYSGETNVVSIHGLSDAHASVIVGVLNGNAPYIAAGKMTNGTGAFTPLRFRTSNADRLIIGTDGITSVYNSMYSRAIYSQRSGTEATSAAGFYCQVDGTTYGGIGLNSVNVQLEVFSAGDLIMRSQGEEKGRFGTDGLGLLGQLYINNANPTVYFRDIDNRSCMLHCNADTFYILNGTGANSINWTQINGRYAYEVNLGTNYTKIGGSLDINGSFVMPNGSITYGTEASTGRSQLFIGGQSLLYLNPTVATRMGSVTVDTGDTMVINSLNTVRKVSSSIIYKTDVEDIEPQYVDNILNLRPIWYRANLETCPGMNPEWSWFGLIAEEVALIEPRLATYRYREEDYDVETGEVKPGAQLVPRGVDYARLSVFLLQHVKNLKATVSTMEARLAAIEQSLGMP